VSVEGDLGWVTEQVVAADRQPEVAVGKRQGWQRRRHVAPPIRLVVAGEQIDGEFPGTQRRPRRAEVIPVEIVAQDGRQSRVSPGDLVAYESTRPYELVGQDRCDIVVLGVPRPMLGPSGDLISRRTALTLPSDRGIRSVIATFFSGLADQADGLSGPSSARLADTVASLLITAFSDTPAGRVEVSTGLADRLLSYALASLHDPGLSAQSVAHRHGISVRYLHKLMRDRDIRFAAWVRRERMRRIRRDLLDPRLAHVTAAGIAARWGIQDPDHLGRSLRAEFGCGAAEIRACAGQLPSPGTSR
jgi:AraC-like DNA-binding protein